MPTGFRAPPRDSYSAPMTTRPVHMTEARIVVVRPDKGLDCPATRHVEKALAREFGGFTRTDGEGHWRDDHNILFIDHISAFDVATVWDASKEAALERIARTAAEIGKQDSYYIRYGDGMVRISKTNA